jgi:hypothetical protein
MMVFGGIQKLSPSFDIKLAFHQKLCVRCIQNNVGLEYCVMWGGIRRMGVGYILE